MQSEERRVWYDGDLDLEVYYFKGVVQKFPCHFHEHYVIGAIGSGRRYALTGGETYLIAPGDLVIFNPRSAHACEQVGDYPLDWRCLNIRPEVMERAVAEITGAPARPVFARTVLFQSELAGQVGELCGMVAEGAPALRKEENFLTLIGALLETCGDAAPLPAAGERPEIQAVCAYLEAHYGESVTLEALAALAGLSRSHLLRCFTRQKGISPYRYLETVRIDRAKALLEEGVPPAETALRTGFSDQSHFTNCFKALTGLTPGQYRSVFRGGREGT